MVHLILTATYTNDIVTLAFDEHARTLEIVSSTEVGHHPSWIAFYPGDHSLVFAGLEQSEGRIVALKYDNAGKGTVVAETASGGADPCSLAASETHLYVANYGGSVACIPISPSPPYILASPPPAVVRLEALDAPGPDPARQEAPHPHQVVLREAHNELLVPDLGADVLRRFTISPDTPTLIPHDPKTFVRYAPGGGPRHIVLHDGYLYTLLELSSVLAQHRFPTSTPPSLITSTPTMSDPPPSPTPMLAAELLLPLPLTNASSSPPTLYVSNRNDPSPLGDLIAIFDAASLERVAEVRSGLNHLRGMAFGGGDGAGDRWLVAGGVNGGGVKVFERVGGRGLVGVAECVGVEKPTGFLWI